MADESSERSFAPTPHRRQMAREAGHVARSHDLTGAALVIAGLMGLALLGGNCARFLADLFRQQLGGEPWLQADASLALNRVAAAIAGLATAVLPILGLLVAAVVVVNFIQTGFLWLPAQAAPRWDRVNPAGGLQRIFSLAAFARLALGLAKLAAIVGVAGYALYDQRDAIARLVALDASAIAGGAAEIGLVVLWKVGVALGLIAILDYAYQRWRYEQDLMMTAEELREEMKSLVGNHQRNARGRAGRSSLDERIEPTGNRPVSKQTAQRRQAA